MLLLFVGLVTCQGSLVKEGIEMHIDEENEWKRKLLEQPEKPEKNQEKLVEPLVQLIVGSVAVVIMMVAIYKCLKNNEKFYQNQGEF